VSPEGFGELSLAQIALPDGETPALLDVLSVPLQEKVPHTCQSENHLIGAGRWGRRGSWPASRVGELVDHVHELWIGGYHSQSGRNDRIPVGLVEAEVTSSLLFVEAEGLVLGVERRPDGLHRIRARFTFRGVEYGLIVTDPLIETRYLPRDVGLYPVAVPSVPMTVSISEPFQGSCYKLAAALIVQPSGEGRS
jgi:hypothetical protein